MVNLKTYNEFLMKESETGPTRMELQKELDKRRAGRTYALGSARTEVERIYGVRLTTNAEGQIVNIETPKDRKEDKNGLRPGEYGYGEDLDETVDPKTLAPDYYYDLGRKAREEKQPRSKSKTSTPNPRQEKEWLQGWDDAGKSLTEATKFKPEWASPSRKFAIAITLNDKIPSDKEKIEKFTKLIASKWGRARMEGENLVGYFEREHHRQQVISALGPKISYKIN